MTLIKTSLLTAISTVIKVIVGFIINKVVSIYAGLSGLAFIGQLQNFIAITTIFSNGAITGGVIKYTAEYQDEEEKKFLFSTALKISVFFSIFIGVVLFILQDFISTKLFGTLEYAPIIMVLACTIILFSLNTLLLSILNGQKEIHKYIFSNITNSIFALFLVTGLTVFLGIKGALLALVLNQTIVFFVTLFFVVNTNWFELQYFIQKFDYLIAKKLFKFLLMAGISVLSSIGSNLIIRNFIGSKLSWDDAGYWQAITYVSDAYLMIVTVSLSVYYLPKLSEIHEKSELKKEILYGFKIIMPIVISMASIIFLLKSFIVEIMFTKEFYPMIELFQWQLVGDVIKIASWLLSMVLVAKAMTTEFIYAEVSTSIPFIITAMFMVNKFGLIGVTYAFTFQYLYYVLLMLFINIKKGTIV